MASIPAHIRRLRAARHMTQEQLAERLFVTRQAVSAWERGKALPDLETLERIAAALDADVTELLYGTSRSPDLRRLRRRWLLTGGGAVGLLAVLLAVLLAALVWLDVWGTVRGGLRYQYFDLNYNLSFQEISGLYSVDIDLDDPDSNVGKVLYEDEAGCRILVTGLDISEEDPREWRIFFRAEGVCRWQGGAMVATALGRPIEKKIVGLETYATMTTAAGGAVYMGSVACYNGMSGSEKLFGYFLFADPHPDPSSPPEGVVTVTFEGLTQLRTIRTG